MTEYNDSMTEYNDSCPRFIPEEWIIPPIPKLFENWGRTDHVLEESGAQERSQWTPIPRIAWGCSDLETWCAWDTEGVIAYMYRGDGPHWVRQPFEQFAFKVKRLF